MAASCPPTPAAIIERAPVDIPDLAKQMHQEGTSMIKVELDEKGKVIKTSVVKSAGASLDGAAIKAAKATSYKSATDECKAVASTFMMLVDMHE
jgi:TonB family protein